MAEGSAAAGAGDSSAIGAYWTGGDASARTDAAADSCARCFRAAICGRVYRPINARLRL